MRNNYFLYQLEPSPLVQGGPEIPAIVVTVK